MSVFDYALLVLWNFYKRRVFSCIYVVNSSMIKSRTPEELTFRVSNFLHPNFCDHPQELPRISDQKLETHFSLMFIEKRQMTRFKKTPLSRNHSKASPPRLSHEAQTDPSEQKLELTSYRKLPSFHLDATTRTFESPDLSLLVQSTQIGIPGAPVRTVAHHTSYIRDSAN